jgi:TATA-box binding protein (TBP) (component of TFIID and TFIIIB)
MTNSIDDEWQKYLYSQHIESTTGIKVANTVVDNTINDNVLENVEIPECDELYISTKTKVLYLNQPIDIHRIFWLLPITEYWVQTECIIKKQMKVVSKSREEYEEYRGRLESIPYYSEHIIKQIDNPTARRIKFKDERKITVGLSKKDIMNCRGKVKNAFYNCFAMIVRFRDPVTDSKKTEFKSVDPQFKEIHVKVFNTGKLEIPGILNSDLLDTVKRMVLEILQPNISSPLFFTDCDKEDNVLINSNFNCGFYIHRERLHTIFRSEKYGIEAAYDPCSYPGVKCKFYYNHTQSANEQTGQILVEDRRMKMSELLESKKYSEISFMIFRTGSVLIVGNCSETILRVVFEFIKKVLTAEYSNIKVNADIDIKKQKVTKIRKKTISLSLEYYNSVIQKLL